MKKIFLIILLVLFLVPLLAQAQLVPEGLVPCGGCAEYGPDPDNPGETKCIRYRIPCQLCHLFVLFDNILNFIFFDIVPPLAILMIAIAGFYFIFSTGDPGKLAQGKTILRTTAIALIIIYGAWLIVHLVLTFPGLIKTDFSGWNPTNWYQINCPTTP